MKLLAIVGTNADFSYNRFLEQFMAKRYKDQADIEVFEIADLPQFKKEAQPDAKIDEFRDKIRQADGIIIATPEYDHGIPSSLKSAMEWTGSHAQGDGNVMKMKPVMVLGTSYGIQGASRAQEEMREILLSPDQTANVLPGNEVLIGHAADKFDKNTGDLIDEAAIKSVDAAFKNFVAFVEQSQK